VSHTLRTRKIRCILDMRIGPACAHACELRQPHAPYRPGTNDHLTRTAGVNQTRGSGTSRWSRGVTAAASVYETKPISLQSGDESRMSGARVADVSPRTQPRCGGVQSFDVGPGKRP
jgi:hypothetical protein